MQSKFTKDYVTDIDSKIPQIIEYFVSFYGERFRPEITTKLTNTRFVFVGSDQSVIEHINQNGYKNLNAAQQALEVQEKSKDRIKKFERAIKSKKDYITNIVNAIAMFIKLEKGVDLAQEYKTEIENALRRERAVNVNALLNYYTYSFMQGKVPLVKPSKSELFNLDNSLNMGENVYNINSLDKIIEIIKQTNREIVDLSKNYSLLYEDTVEFLSPLKEKLNKNEFEELMQVVAMQDLLGEHCDALHLTAIAKDLDRIENIVFIKVNQRNFDNVLIHELFHAVETHIIKLQNNAVSFGSGLTSQIRRYEGDRFELDYNSIPDYPEQLLDEVMVDWRASELADKMYQEGFEIINNKGVCVSVYAECFTSCDRLFGLIKPEINKFSFYGKKSQFIEFLGRENYYKLANACCYIASDDAEEDVEQIKRENPEIEYDDQLLEKLYEIKTDNDYVRALKTVQEVTNSVEEKVKRMKNRDNI